MTLGDLTLATILLSIVIYTFLGVIKLGLNKYLETRGFIGFILFILSLTILITGITHLLIKVNWDYKLL